MEQPGHESPHGMPILGGEGLAPALIYSFQEWTSPIPCTRLIGSRVKVMVRCGYTLYLQAV